VIDCDVFLARRKLHIFAASGVNGQHRAGILPAAVIAMAGVDKVAVLLNHYFHLAAYAMTSNVFHQ
jgi:hypothetical protein